MWGTYLHDLSRSQVTARIYSSERWKKFRCTLKFSSCKFIKKFRPHFHDLCVQKRSCFPWSSDTFFEFCAFKVNKKCFGRIFTIHASKNEEFCCEWDAFWKFSACKIYKNNSGCIFTSYAAKNEAVCREVQTDFGNFLHGHILTIFASKLKLFPAKLGRILEICALWGLRRKFCAFSRFLRPKTKLFAVKFKRIFEVLRLQGLQKKFRAHFHDLCVQKWSCFLRSSDAFRKFSVCKFCRKCSGRIFTIYAS